MAKKEWEIDNWKKWEIDNWNEWKIKKVDSDLKNFYPDYYYLIFKIILLSESFKNDIEEFKRFRESKQTVTEATLEDFAKKYIRIIEVFWEIFFRDVLKLSYRNVRIELIDEEQLLKQYRLVNWSLFYQPIWNTIVIVKDRFFKDFEYILKWDAWIILAFAHEIWHAVQSQYEKEFRENMYNKIDFHWWKHIEDSLEYLEYLRSKLYANIRLNENKADFYAWICGRILYESWIFNEDDLENWKNSFYFLWLFWCIDTHWTPEERRQIFIDWFNAWWEYVYLIKQKTVS